MTIPTVLKRIKALEGLNQQDCELILKNTSVKKYPAQTIIFNEGEDGDALYIIRTGKVRIYKPKSGKDKKDIDIAVLKEKDFFGEMALVADQKRSATAITQEESQIYVLTKSAFYVLVEKNPDMATRISDELMRRVNENIKKDI